MDTQVTHEVKDAVVQQVSLTTQFLEQVKEFFLNRGFDLVMAVLIAVLGYIIAHWCRRLVRKMLERTQVDRSVIGFISEIAYWTVMIIALAMVLGQLGVSTASLAAAVGGVGLAIGLAMKDNFGNVASGIFILTFKPFRSGDYIEAAGFSGTVIDILTMYTRIRTQGNELILIPNSKMTDSVIKNFTYFSTRNIEFVFDVGYATDLPQCIQVLTDIFNRDEGVVNKGNIPIYVKELGESSIRIYARVEVRSDIFFAERNRLYIHVKEAFDQKGIDIPYPQMVIHEGKKQEEEIH